MVQHKIKDGPPEKKEDQHKRQMPDQSSSLALDLKINAPPSAPAPYALRSSVDFPSGCPLSGGARYRTLHPHGRPSGSSRPAPGASGLPDGLSAVSARKRTAPPSLGAGAASGAIVLVSFVIALYFKSIPEKMHPLFSISVMAFPAKLPSRPVPSRRPRSPRADGPAPLAGRCGFWRTHASGGSVRC